MCATAPIPSVLNYEQAGYSVVHHMHSILKRFYVKWKRINERQRYETLQYSFIQLFRFIYKIIENPWLFNFHALLNYHRTIGEFGGKGGSFQFLSVFTFRRKYSLKVVRCIAARNMISLPFPQVCLYLIMKLCYYWCKWIFNCAFTIPWKVLKIGETPLCTKFFNRSLHIQFII